MKNRLYKIAITLFWLIAMGWLVQTWVLPWILVGDPPKETERLSARQETPVVCWEIQIAPITPTAQTTSPAPSFFDRLNPFRKNSPTDSPAAQNPNVPPPNATESNATESNATESNATESNVTESNVTESNVTESNVTESNVTESNVTESNVPSTSSRPATVSQSSSKTFGRAYCHYQMTGAGISHVSSSVEFEGLPVRELLPMPVQLLLGNDLTLLEDLPIVCRTHMWFDPLGKLTLFESRVWIPSLSTENAFILIAGYLRTSDLSDQLHLTVSVMGENPREMDLPLNEETPWAEMFTPETQLPGLKVGQSWTIRTYNPFDTAVSSLNPLGNLGFSSTGITMLRAEVTGRRSLTWNGEEHSVLEVVQTNAQSDLHGNTEQEPVGKLYVDDAGNVLQEECYWNRHVIRFVRDPLPPRDSEEYNTLIRKVETSTSELRRNQYIIPVPDENATIEGFKTSAAH